MKISKTLNVKTPEISTLGSVGLDLFVPVFDDKFINWFMQKPNNLYMFEIDGIKSKLARKIVGKEKLIVYLSKNDVDSFNKALNDYRKAITEKENCPNTQTKLIVLKNYINIHSILILNIKNSKSELIVNKPVTIPTGIMFDMPKDIFIDIRGKSSSMYLGYRVIYSTIDSDYTYPIGVQIEPIEHSFTLYENQKFAQAVLMKKFEEKLELIDSENFESSENVINKRKIRNGGFGSTGLN